MKEYLERNKAIKSFVNWNNNLSVYGRSIKIVDCKAILIRTSKVNLRGKWKFTVTPFWFTGSVECPTRISQPFFGECFPSAVGRWWFDHARISARILAADFLAADWGQRTRCASFNPISTFLPIDVFDLTNKNKLNFILQL